MHYIKHSSSDSIIRELDRSTRHLCDGPHEHVSRRHYQEQERDKRARTEIQAETHADPCDSFHVEEAKCQCKSEVAFEIQKGYTHGCREPSTTDKSTVSGIHDLISPAPDAGGGARML